MVAGHRLIQWKSFLYQMTLGQNTMFKHFVSAFVTHPLLLQG